MSKPSEKNQSSENIFRMKWQPSPSSTSGTTLIPTFRRQKISAKDVRSAKGPQTLTQLSTNVANCAQPNLQRNARNSNAIAKSSTGVRNGILLKPDATTWSHRPPLHGGGGETPSLIGNILFIQTGDFCLLQIEKFKVKVCYSSFDLWPVGPFVGDTVNMFLYSRDEKEYRRSGDLPKFCFKATFYLVSSKRCSIQITFRALKELSEKKLRYFRMYCYEYFKQSLDKAAQLQELNGDTEDLLEFALEVLKKQMAIYGEDKSFLSRCLLKVNGKNVRYTGISGNAYEPFLVDILMSAFVETTLPRVLKYPVPDVVARFLDAFIESFPFQLNVLYPAIEALRCVGFNKNKLRFLVSPSNTAIGGSSDDILKHIANCLEAWGGEGIYKVKNWKLWPIIPNLSDPNLNNHKLLPIVKERYDSLEEYISTYFRLLYANCFMAIARNVALWNENNMNEDFWRSVQLYQAVPIDVCFQEAKCGLVLDVMCKRIIKNKLCKPRPADLMDGNLVVVSLAGYAFEEDDVIWAEIDKREVNNKSGIVSLRPLQNSKFYSQSKLVIALLSVPSKFLLIENPVFYKSFAPVLKVLQKKTDWTLHQALTCNSPIAMENERLPWADKVLQNYNESEGESDDESMESVESLCENLGVLNFEDRTFSRQFDPSQHAAIRMMIKSPIALVQGPPGTGKTSVGVRFIKELFRYNEQHPKTPVRILVMSYKNHALDEFLLNCIKLSPAERRIVRLGGNSKQLSETPLARLRYINDNRDTGFQKDVENQLSLLYETVEKNLKDCAKAIDPMEAVLKQCRPEQLLSLSRRCFYHYNLDIMDIQHVKNLERGLDEIRCCIAKWMNFCGMTDMGFMRTPPTEKVGKEKPTANEAAADEAAADEAASDEEENSQLEEEEAYNTRSDRACFIEKRTDAMRMKLDPIKFPPLWSRTLKSGFPMAEIIDDLYSIQSYGREFVEEMKERQQAIWADKLEQFLSPIESLLKNKFMLREESKLAALSDVWLLGCTITGASINNDLIQRFQPTVAVIEEAAEILEPMILAALPSSLKQFILIGDHMQLRPLVDEYKLIKHNHFDLSMMERLVINAEKRQLFPFKRLHFQCRMRIELAEMVKLFYPNLKTNVEAVRNHEPLAIIKTTRFFLSKTTYEESKGGSIGSFENINEAEDILLFINHILFEGYLQRQITVLAMYGGQLKLLKKMLQKFPDVHCQSVDSYQGDENDFVLISLVRSKALGFIAVLNRVIVAISRARCGVYFFGNGDLLKTDRRGWGKIICHLIDKMCYGSEIPIICPRHPDIIIQLGSNCKHLCKEIMSCGHECRQNCHIEEQHPDCSEIVAFPCEECQNPLERACSDHKKLCRVKIDVSLHPCKHTAVKECWQNTKDISCNTMVNINCSKCFRKGRTTCEIKVKSIEAYKCKEPCVKTMDCGHICPLLCHEECCNSKDCGVCEEIQKKHKEEKVAECKAIINKIGDIDYWEILEKKPNETEAPIEFAHKLDLLVEKNGSTPRGVKWKALQSNRLKKNFYMLQEKLLNIVDEVTLVLEVNEKKVPETLNSIDGIRSLFQLHIDAHTKITTNQQSLHILVCRCQRGRTLICENNSKEPLFAKKPDSYDTMFDPAKGTYRFWNSSLLLPTWLVEVKFEDCCFVKISIPDHWTSKTFNHDSRVTLVNVEDQTVKSVVLKALLETSHLQCRGVDGYSEVRNASRIEIQRVENMELWSNYCKRKDTMLSKVKKNDFKPFIPKLMSEFRLTGPEGIRLDCKINEYWLFHGTKKNTAKIISEQGFDERVSNLKGMYGAGCYFTDEACKASQYTCGEKCLLVNRVLLGDIEVSNEPMNLQRRPSENPQTNTLYDSVDGCLGQHRELIVYDRNQIYPEYIITW